MEKIKNILADLRPITLSEMDTVKLMNRVDTKFAFSVEELIQILPKLSNDFNILEIEGTRLPSYKSLYFDENDFKFYNDHHNGRTSRYKVRFRKYVESEIYFLEVKHKYKGRTHKTRIKVDEFENELSPTSLAFLEDAVEDLDNIQPTMWNSFNRMTLVSQERKERLTLDINLKFEWKDNTKVFENLVIAELKQERVDRNTPFFQLMKKEGIRPYRLSKYCIGTIELYSKKRIKYNRFKEKLLKLKTINKNAS